MSATETITTHEYSIRRSRYFALLCSRIGRDWWSVPLLIIAALTIATCYDLRFGIVLLLVVFVIAPMLLFLAYYHYALLPECIYSIVPKSLIINKHGIDCIAYEKQRHVLDWDKVKQIITTHDAYLLYTWKYTFLYIPFNAFATPEEQQAFHDDIIPAVFRIEKDE